MSTVKHHNYNQLVATIGSLLELGKQKAFQKVNTILVETYWNIGKQIIEFEQAGEARVEESEYNRNEISDSILSYFDSLYFDRKPEYSYYSSKEKKDL